MSYADAAREANAAAEKDAKNLKAEANKQAESASKEAGKAAEDFKAAASDAKDKATKKAKEIGDDLKKAEKDASDKIKKEYDANKGPVIDFFKKIGAKISEAASYVVESTKSAAVTTSEELKNPVVASQVAVTIGAIAGLSAGIAQREKIFRFKSDNEITAILAGLAGLVVLDGYLFKTYYPKYDKKSLK
ncbi:CYFA0S02e09626g1_1 [Cyberlindnera fabianii]|uniref:CYFA0S02e09626g1_1 n=1 Tax=Cyberlindnera fabianii TaxID=36022 RepID=A0A061AN26_CYBFA|nr:Mitochondrial outer membrane protein OM14 [Cyberlindnera fabianii]CDR38965.1 CYFA0S02e09626g1_1 [Cyberlindnera fabianii]